MRQTLGGRYALTGFLASDETGDVWRGRDRLTGRLVAVKVLHPRLATDPRVGERFLRSRDALTALWHPNVVPLLDLVVDEEVVALVTELVEGTDLGRWLTESGPLPPAQAAEVAATVAEALDTAHQIGLVHGDVKPANILVPPRFGGAIRLTDFSVALLVRIGTGDKLAGPLPYHAPEVVDGAVPTGPSDVYALGIVLHEMVVGTPHRRGHPDDAALAALFDVVDRCVEYEPAARPSAADVFARLWEIVPRLVETAPRDGVPDRVDAVPTPPPSRTAPVSATSGPPRRGSSRLGPPRLGSPRLGSGRRGLRRAVLFGLGGVGAVVALAVGALVAAEALRAPAPPAPSSAPASVLAAPEAPTLPAAAATRTPRGADEFLRHWFATLTYAEETGDTGPLAERTSPSCAECRTAIETIRAAYANGGALRGGVYVVRSVAQNSLLNLERPVYEATLDRSSRSDVDSAGGLRGTLPALSFANCVLVLEWTGQRWRVFEVTSRGCLG